MKTIHHGAIANLALEFVPRHAAVETYEKFSAGRGVGDVPHFSFWLATRFDRFVGRGMDLKGKVFLSVEQFDEQRETTALKIRRTEHFRRLMFHEPAQVFAGERAVGDDVYVAGPVADFPRFADGHVRRQRLAKQPFEVAPTPDTLFKDRMEYQAVEHREIYNELTIGRRLSIGFL